ncbi:GAP family protein [Mycobacterium spongiae]|uniref:GAP family protein n=1 Tax=Mycobacterium spongiae TaxID=886343 RepID=A0A975K1N7_9MYCO|nr:GAP family protein [Mycobacterium spongiae]QUR69049.1 GAP family protein [Mycobacterium spongiae]
MRRLLPVTGSWVSILTGLVPLALVVALSPLTVIPAVLVLHAPRPRPASLAFLGGWLLGLAAVTASAVVASGAFGGLHRTPPAWASWLRVVLGSALIAFGIFRWLTRHRETETPAWMRTFAKFTPVRAAVVGAALVVVRPEVLIISGAAGFAIGSSGRGVAGAWFSVAFYVALAASTVAIPILGYVAAGHRLDAALERLKVWMEKNHAGMSAAVLAVIGLLVLYNGIHAL